MPLSTSASERNPLPFTSNWLKSFFRRSLSAADVPASAACDSRERALRSMHWETLRRRQLLAAAAAVMRAGCNSRERARLDRPACCGARPCAQKLQRHQLLAGRNDARAPEGSCSESLDQKSEEFSLESSSTLPCSPAERSRSGSTAMAAGGGGGAALARRRPLNQLNFV